MLDTLDARQPNSDALLVELVLEDGKQPLLRFDDGDTEVVPDVRICVEDGMWAPSRVPR